MPEQLGRFEIVDEIGRGGFAVVYRAHDTRLDRQVALKELRQSFLNDSEWVKRFTREALTIAKLNHAHIITIHDVLETDERLFIVMRLVEGPSLEQLIARQGPLPWSEALNIITILADALEYAHTQDILHRDLKPANILLDPERGPQLSDFGLAKLVAEGGSSITAAGAIVGTPHYIAPEMWEGQGSSKQSDIYALGCILYEILTAEKLFAGDSPPAVMMAHFNPLTLPTSWPDQVPPGIGEILEQALARDPRSRYTNVGEMANALAGLGQAQRETGPHTNAPQTAQPKTRSLPTRVNHNLPAQMTPFIGREADLAELARLLAASDNRLVTIAGPGGMGKTRLMLHVAGQVVDDYAAGVWLVELAPLTNPGLIVERVAAVLTVQEQPGQPLLETLTAYLRRKELLLLLDNVEHLVRASAELAQHLLLNCPSIKILVTGRETLFIEGETTWQIPALSLPDTKEDMAPADIRTSEAVQLFLARAQAIRPDFDLTARNAPVIAEVVRRLDGIPLALELAAVRLRLMSVEQIAARLNDRFRLLTGGRRTALPRQQTLQALIDWSWNLLDGQERTLLRRLAVFSGGWTLEAAQAVAGDEQLDEFEIVDHLDQLINKSLVMVDHLPAGEVRYHLLESIRQYARDRLLEAGEEEAIYNRHAEYFVAFGEQLSKAIEGRDMPVWLDRLWQEADNAAAAREWALERRLDLALRMLRYSILVLRYWSFSREGSRWLEQVVAQARRHPAVEIEPEYRQGLASALITLGAATFARGDPANARVSLEEGVALAQEAGVVGHRVFGLNMLLVVLLNLGDAETAGDVAEQALALNRLHGSDFMRLMTLGSLAWVLAFQGKHEQARANTEAALQLAQQLGNPWMTAVASFEKGRLEINRKNWAAAEECLTRAAELFEAVRDIGFVQIVRSELGHLKRKQGDFEGAKQVYRQSIIGYQEYGQSAALAHQLECFGMIAAYQNRPTRAARLLGAAQALRESLASRRFPPEQTEFDQALAHLAEAMGEAARDAALAEGKIMSPDEAVLLALEESP